MAAMDQAKLNNMSSKINSEASNYVSEMQNDTKDLLSAFNTNWVSKSAQTLATEIKECLDSLADAITKTFDAKNESIKMSVKNFNAVENENINYNEFEFGKPSISLDLNDALPNGKVGVADKADLNDIKTPVETLATNVAATLDNIITTVNSIDAFSDDEQQGLVTSVTNIKNKFESEMDELKNSLNTRMSGEISARDELNRVNVQNLSS